MIFFSNLLALLNLRENVFFQQTDVFDLKEKNYDVVFLNGVWYLYNKKDVLMQFLLVKTKDN